MRDHTNANKIIPPRLNRLQIRQAVKSTLGPALSHRPAGYWAAKGLWTFDTVRNHARGELGDLVVVPSQKLGDCSTGRVLGEYRWRENTILLADCIDPGREFAAKAAFTYWHELGHAILHRLWMIRLASDRMRGLVDSTATIDPACENALEWQANYFATCAAMPRPVLAAAFQQTFRRPSMPYVGTRLYNVLGRRVEIQDIQQLAWHCASALSPVFGGLSAEAISYRLLELRIVYSDGGLRGLCNRDLVLRRVA